MSKSTNPHECLGKAYSSFDNLDQQRSEENTTGTLGTFDAQSSQNKGDLISPDIMNS